MNVRGTDTSVPAWERAWAASGALTVVLFAAGLVFGDLLGSDNYPALEASTDEVRRYFLENETEVRALSFFHMLAALPCSGSLPTCRRPCAGTNESAAACPRSR